MASIGRWTGGAVSGIPTETLAAPSGFFATQQRNDGSIYSLNSSTATLTLPSSDLADGYLVVASYIFQDTSNGRANFQGTFEQTSGTGNFVASLTGGYNRNNNNSLSYVRSWAFIDSPSASAQIQFQWSRDTDTPIGGITESSFEVIPLYYKNYIILESTNTAFNGGTTPTAIPGFTTSSSSGSWTVTSGQVTLPANAKIWAIQSAGISYNTNTRTQRWMGFLLNGTKVDYAKAYSFYRNSSNGKVGNFSTLALNSGASDTLQPFMYRGDGVANLQGGADVDGATSGTDPCYRHVILELNDSAEFLTTNSSSNSSNFNTDPTLSETITVDATADWLFSADVAAASNDVTSGARGTYEATATLASTAQSYTKHGNYIRGNQGTQDTFGFSANLLSAIAATNGQALGVDITQTGDGHSTVAPSGWVGLKALNLDTLSGSTPVTVSVTGVSATGGVGSVSVTGDASTSASGPQASNNFSPEYDLTLTGTEPEGQISGSFTTLNQDIVFAGEVQLPSSFTQTECLFEHGGTGSGTWLGVAKIDSVYYLRFRSGTGTTTLNTPDPTQFCLQNVAISDIPEFDGNTHTVVWEMSVTNDRIRLWIDGREIINYTMTGQLSWSGGDVGGWGAGYSGIAGGTTDTGTTQYQAATAWSGTIASELRYYNNQLPDFGASVTVAAAASTSVTGESATGSVGSVSVTGDASTSVTGESATGSIGSVSVTADGSTSVTGESATGSVGNVSVTGDASTSVTGLSATGAVGSVSISVDVSVSVTGEEATSAVGSVTVVTDAGIEVPVTGVSATGGLGTTSVVADASTDTTGVSATGGLGSVSVVADAVVSASGLEATSGLGTTSVVADASTDTTGVSATGGLGSVSVTVDINASVTGVSATSNLGTVSVVAGAVASASGLEATSSLGNVSVVADATTDITGVSATSGLGSVSVVADAVTSASGLEATSGLGTVSITASAITTANGSDATGAVGDVEVLTGEFIPVTGVESTGAVGDVVIVFNALVDVTGVESSGTLGDVVTSSDAIVGATGLEATGAINSVVVGLGAGVDVTGVESTTSLGTVSVTNGTTVSPIGVECSGAVGEVAIWGEIPTDQTPNWQAISDGQTPSWSDVSTGQNPNWQGVADTQTPNWGDLDSSQNPNWDEVAA